MKQIYVYDTLDNLPLEVTFYPASAYKGTTTLLYFHGGGLLYGDRDDLPEVYIEQLTKNGFQLLTFDYPLLPESTLTTIFETLAKGIHWFTENYQTILHLSSNDYVLFGRSAGAYLALCLGSNNPSSSMKGIVSFYGYSSLLEPSFSQPNHYYQQFPSVSPTLLQEIIQEQPCVHGQILERFPLYIHSRQTGQWPNVLTQAGEKKETFSLTRTDLEKLPPTFVTASTGDQDIPFYLSNDLARQIPHATLHRVQNLPHDFDRDTTIEAGKEAYKALIQWLHQIIDK